MGWGMAEKNGGWTESDALLCTYIHLPVMFKFSHLRCFNCQICN